MRALPLVTFFFSHRSNRGGQVSRAEPLASDYQSYRRRAERAGKESSSSLGRMAAMPTTKEKGPSGYTDCPPISPARHKKAIWPVSADSKVFVAMVRVWSEDQWVRSKKGISSSLATPTNVVDCVPGGHFLHFVGTGNNGS